MEKVPSQLEQLRQHVDAFNAGVGEWLVPPGQKSQTLLLKIA